MRKCSGLPPPSLFLTLFPMFSFNFSFSFYLPHFLFFFTFFSSPSSSFFGLPLLLSHPLLPVWSETTPHASFTHVIAVFFFAVNYSYSKTIFIFKWRTVSRCQNDENVPVSRANTTAAGKSGWMKRYETSAIRSHFWAALCFTSSKSLERCTVFRLFQHKP